MCVCVCVFMRRPVLIEVYFCVNDYIYEKCFYVYGKEFVFMVSA